MLSFVIVAEAREAQVFTQAANGRCTAVERVTAQAADAGNASFADELAAYLRHIAAQSGDGPVPMTLIGPRSAVLGLRRRIAARPCGAVLSVVEHDAPPGSLSPEAVAVLAGGEAWRASGGRAVREPRMRRARIREALNDSATP